MSNEALEKLKYPIGPFERPSKIVTSDLTVWKQTIADFPEQMRVLTANLSETEKSWRYRPEGWNVAQVVHHCADSHMNAYIRFKWTLTEEKPTIKAYDEKSWAVLPDATDLDLTNSLALIAGLHGRWSQLLNTFSPENWLLEYIHPDHESHFSLAVALANYDWHCRHHLAHIMNALAADGMYG